MKKVIIFLVIIIALFAGMAFLNSQSGSESSTSESVNKSGAGETEEVGDNPYGKESLHQDTIKQLDDENYQKLILPDDLKEKLDNKEDAVVYFYSPSCSHCQATTPDVMAAAEAEDIDIQQYNLLEFEEGWNDYGIEFTPTLVVFEDGKEKERNVGALENKEAYIDFFNEHAN